jgi:hypothetical protein
MLLKFNTNFLSFVFKFQVIKINHDPTMSIYVPLYFYIYHLLFLENFYNITSS